MNSLQGKNTIKVNINGVFNTSVGTIVTYYMLNDNPIRVGDIICDNDNCYIVKGFGELKPNDIMLFSAVVEQVM
ncbi:MAG: hypothetical protein GX802_04885 [Clostridiales bacterium]|jgi:hypothetical protein|nr:hypothetical protein [Clostridiales bacterium]